MIINKFKEKSVVDSSKMTSYINLFLKTEVTCIPKLLKNYLGDYYNNALFNGATWVFVLWCVLHVLFDKVIDAFLKKLRYREYVRLRLRNSLWYLGFYGTAVVYSSAALAQNEVELFNFKKMHVPSSSSLPSQVVIGYTLLSTFFLHSSLWEGLAKERFLNMLSYLFLFLFLVSSYILRVVEISFTLTALIGIAQLVVEFTRCCFMSSIQESFISKLLMGLIYFTTYAICFAVYIIVVPLTFVVPLGLKILSDYPNILLLFLFINLGGWLMLEIYQSVLFKFLDHWFYHQEEKESDNFLQCSIGLLECSLFKPRDDISYNLQIIQKEIKSRQAKMMSMRKPKNKPMLLQTLKCMLAIKRKLNVKRRSESSDSDSEKSEENKVKTSETVITDEDNGEQLSDQDEETDDELLQDGFMENKEDLKICGECQQSDHKESDTDETESINSDLQTEKEDSPEETENNVKIFEKQKLHADNNCIKSDNQGEAENSDIMLNIKLSDNTLTLNIKRNVEEDNVSKLKTADVDSIQKDDDQEMSHLGEHKSAPLKISGLENQKCSNVSSENGNDVKQDVSSHKSEDNDNNNSIQLENENTIFGETGNNNKEAITSNRDVDCDNNNFVISDHDGLQKSGEYSAKNQNTDTILVQSDNDPKEVTDTNRNEDNDNNKSIRSNDILQKNKENLDTERINKIGGTVLVKDNDIKKVIESKGNENNDNDKSTKHNQDDLQIARGNAGLVVNEDDSENENITQGDNDTKEVTDTNKYDGNATNKSAKLKHDGLQVSRENAELVVKEETEQNTGTVLIVGDDDIDNDNINSVIPENEDVPKVKSEQNILVVKKSKKGNNEEIEEATKKSD